MLAEAAGATAFASSLKAAFAASCTATVALHPLDTLKSRLQSDAYAVRPTAVFSVELPAIALVGKEPWTGGGATIFDMPVLRRNRRPRSAAAPRQRLFDGLYKGMGANVLKEAPDAAVYLAVSEQLTHALQGGSPWFAAHLTLTLALAGGIGDAVGSVLRLPAEVMCKRLQTGDADNTAEALSGISLDGWLASWTAILYRDVPFGGLQIAAYQQAHSWTGGLADAIREAAGDAVPSWALVLPAASASDLGADLAGLGAGLADLGADLGADVAALSSAGLSHGDVLSDMPAGVVAGTLAAALTTPLDVLVTHVTTHPSPTDGSAPPSALQLGADLVREQGAATLTRGLGLRVMYYAPLVGCFFALYEHFLLVL